MCACVRVCVRVCACVRACVCGAQPERAAKTSEPVCACALQVGASDCLTVRVPRVCICACGRASLGSAPSALCVRQWPGSRCRKPPGQMPAIQCSGTCRRGHPAFDPLTCHHRCTRTGRGQPMGRSEGRGARTRGPCARARAVRIQRCQGMTLRPAARRSGSPPARLS